MADEKDDEVIISSIGSFEKFVFPMINAVYPIMTAQGLVWGFKMCDPDCPTCLEEIQEEYLEKVKETIRVGI